MDQTENFMPNYPKKNFDHAIVAVDVVIFTIQEGVLKALVLKLKEKPFEEKYAFPGGLVHISESVDEAAIRHLKNKAGIEGVYLEQLYTFGQVDRDPFGRVISVAYYALVPSGKVVPHTSDRYADAQWIDINMLKNLAYDHREILTAALERLRAKLGYTNIIYSLLPLEFTLTELQETYEIVLGHSLDKRNFRKKILSLDLIKETSHKRGGMASRPAQLYSFKAHKPTIVEIL